MKLDKILNLKTLLVLGAALLLIGAVTSMDLTGLQKGSIVPQAITIQNINGIDCAIVSMDGRNYDDTDIGTVQPSESAHYDVDGNVDSEGNTIEGDFDAVIKLKVLNTGWSMQTTSYQTDPFINKVWAEECGWLNEKTCTRTETGDPITYYHVTHDMTPLAEYEVWAVVNGEEQPHAIVKPQNTQQTIELPGTDPVIYWRETSYGLDGQSVIPIGADNVDIIRKDDTGNVIFAAKNEVAVAADFWNTVLLEDRSKIMDKARTYQWTLTKDGVIFDESICTVEDNLAQRLDFDGDDIYDVKVSASPMEFPITKLEHNEYRFKNCDGIGCFGCPTHWIDMPSLHRMPYMSDKDTDGYTLSGDGKFLLRDGRITVSGTFQIPLEYGDVRVVTRDADPEIVSTSDPFEIFTGGFKEVTVSVKNNGETGHVLVIPELKEGSLGSVSLPDSQNKLIPAGDTVDFVFKFDSNDVGIGDVIFYANAGSNQDSITIGFEVSEPAPGAELRSVRIVAVSKEGSELESIYPGKFPITVDQNSVTEYGIWEGQLWEGSPVVSGEIVVVDGLTWYPEDDKIIVIEEDDHVFTFTYSTEKPKEGVDFIWYIIGGTLMGILILTAYIYKVDYMNKGKKR